MTFSITDIQQNDALDYAECRVLFTVMLGDITLNFVMLSAVVPRQVVLYSVE